MRQSPYGLREDRRGHASDGKKDRLLPRCVIRGARFFLFSTSERDTSGKPLRIERWDRICLFGEVEPKKVRRDAFHFFEAPGSD